MRKSGLVLVLVSIFLIALLIPLAISQLQTFTVTVIDQNRNEVATAYIEQTGILPPTFNVIIRSTNPDYQFDEINIEEYLYDHEGNRILKQTENETTFYINKNFIRVQNASGNFDTVYYYDKDTLLARKDPDGKKYFYHRGTIG